MRGNGRVGRSAIKSVNVALIMWNKTRRKTGDRLSVLQLVSMGSHAAITGMQAIVIWSFVSKFKTDPLGGIEEFIGARAVPQARSGRRTNDI